MGLGEASTIDEVRSIPALAQWAAARDGDAEAVVDGDTRLTFDDLAGSALVATRASMALGIEPGDRVAIWAPKGGSGSSPRSVCSAPARCGYR